MRPSFTQPSFDGAWVMSKNHSTDKLSFRQIPLTQGYFAIVDPEDYDWLMQWKWCLHKTKTNIYAHRRLKLSNDKNTTMRMHRAIMKAPKGLEVDHKNGNGLDNRRCNLRIASRLQNTKNTKKRKNTSSQYKGVSWHKKCEKWVVHIRINSVTVHIGLFFHEHEAATAYNKAAKLHYGEFAKLNKVTNPGYLGGSLYAILPDSPADKSAG